jgi:hypothetical protein
MYKKIGSTGTVPGYRALVAGEQWHSPDFALEMLEGGYRPLLLGEPIVWDEGGDECRLRYEGVTSFNWQRSYQGCKTVPSVDNVSFWRTKRPLPSPSLAPPPEKVFGIDRVTERGFHLVEFHDEYGNTCSIQESSRAVCENEDGTVDDPLGWLWLGIDDPKPQIMKSKALALGLKLPPGEVSGWMPYPIPDDVSINTRMHLNEAQVRGLIDRLTRWLETGVINSTPQTDMRWCYSESAPYDLNSLGEAWQTGCPLCGEQCLQSATEEDKKEAEEYYKEYYKNEHS